MNDKTKGHQFKNAERLIKVYVPDAEELALSFSGLYIVACKRDEAAAEALRLDCETDIGEAPTILVHTTDDVPSNTDPSTILVRTAA